MPLLDRILGRRTSTALAEALVAHLPRRGGLVASAAVLRPEEGKRLAKASKSRAWQKASFGYARALPEVGYALRFLTNNSAHIRLFVGDRQQHLDEVAELNDGYGWLDDERTRRDPNALPDDLVEAAQSALDLLTGASPSGGGRTILGPIVRGYETVGEAYLVGRLLPSADGRTIREEWAVHSISEVTWQEHRYPGSPQDAPRGYFRLVTGDGRDAETVDLDPASTTVVRLWTADAEWSSEPDSPMRALVGVCERLLLIEKGDDATFRSRAAGNGVLLWPEELDAIPEDEDDEEDETAADLNKQLTTPLTLDGSAAQVVPWLYRGASQYLDKIRHLTFGRPLDPVVSERESRLLARLGIGLDVPPEVIAGLGATNHWNAAQITSDTFRHHQEPITIAAVEGLTLGYLRARLIAANRWPEELIRRLVIWYDPSGLVAPADMREAANDAHDRKAINDEAYRTALGFDESAAPPAELTTGDAPVGDTGMPADRLRVVSEIAGNLLRSGYEPDAVSAALGLAIAHTGYVPVTVKPPEDGPLAVPPVPALPPAAPPAEDPPPPPASAAIIAAATPTAEHRRLSRRLTQIEQRLRERIAAAADAALARALERAGNRARAAAQRDDTARAAVAGQAPEQVIATLGRPIVAALGLEEQQLLADAFARLRVQYAEWTEAAAEEALDTACRLAGLDRADPSVARSVAELRDRFHDNAEASWPHLEEGLQQLAADRLYEPVATDTPAGEAADGLVPPGLIREALAHAGGLAADHDGRPPLSGLTSGQLLDGFLRDAGAEVVEYEWAYGISSRPFPPHADLDGVVFAGFDDDALSSAGTGHSWVGGSFAPGDHKGCHCDYVPIYTDGRDTRAELEHIGATDYEERHGPGTLPTRQATVDPDVFRDDRGRPEQRRTPTARDAHATRTAPPVVAPPAEPVQARAATTRGRRRQAAADEAGVPMRLDHAYLSALSEEQLDDLAAHVAARLDDTNPAEGQRWDDLSAFLDYSDEERRVSEQLTEAMASDEEWQAAYTRLDATLGRPGVTSPRVGGRGAREVSTTPTRREVQDEYALYVEQQFVAAEEATNGYTVTPAGRARGLTTRSMLTGDVRDVYRYATDEMLDHLEANRRITWSEFYYAKTENPAFADLARRAYEANSRISRDSSTRRRNPR